MTFNSIEEAINYIENAIPDVLYDTSFDMQEIMTDEISHQIYSAYSPVEYNRTGDLMESPGLVDISTSHITMEFQDNGGWSSVFPPHEHMNAFEMHEEGKVWTHGTNSDKGIYKFKPATNIVDASFSKCKQEIPDKFASHLRNKGIPIE